MNAFRKGYSLRYPMMPKSEEDADRIIAEFLCAACESQQAEDMDFGQTFSLGFLIYREVIKTCVCGFQNRIFVVINDPMKQQIARVLSSREAHDRVVDRIDDPALDEGSSDLMLARFKQDWEKATEIAQKLVKSFPQFPQVWYDLGYIYGEQGRFREAVAVYQRAHELDPELVDAWYNQGLMYSKLGYHREAILCMEKVAELSPDWGELARFKPKEMARATGVSGEIKVVQDAFIRRLQINGQTQGGAFLTPDAALFHPGEVTGPGPVAEGFFTVGWYLAAVNADAGKGLMLGLGSGMAAVSLLHQFPFLRIDVVELDDVIINMAEKWFPLVAYYRKQGRLVIHHKDAKSFVAENQQKYAFSILDLYSGSRNQVDFAIDIDFLMDLGSFSKALWMNVIGKLTDNYIPKVIRAFEAAKLNVGYIASQMPRTSWATAEVNWLLASTDVDIKKSRAFIPFARLKGEEAHQIRHNYNAWTKWYMDGEQIKHWLETGSLQHEATV